MNDFNLGISILCTIIIAFAWTYIKKLQKENDTKDRAIIGLREIIRLLEEKIK